MAILVAVRRSLLKLCVISKVPAVDGNRFLICDLAVFASSVHRCDIDLTKAVCSQDSLLREC